MAEKVLKIHKPPVTVVPPVSGNETGDYREPGQGIIGNRGREPSGSETGGYREAGQIYRAKSAK